VTRAVCAALAALVLVLAPGLAGATQRWGPVQLSGNLQSQNLIRHPDADDFHFIQNRNSVRLKLEYAWLERGKFYGKYNIPFIESSNLFLLYRGVYDSIYDTTPYMIEKEDIHGHSYGGKNLFEYAKSLGRVRALTLDGLGRDARDRLKFENSLREIYADITFRGIPLTVRAGKQQIVWGEADDFRMLDRVNTLDLTWHLAQEVPPPSFGWDELRQPFWMLKFLYDLGDVWKFSQSFLEWYWNPGDWRPPKIAFLPRPWGIKSLDPLTNPIDGGFIGGVCANSPVLNPALGVRQCTQLMNGTKLFRQGDYNRNPMENSQVGVRYHGITPNGIEFTLNYLYQRWGGDDGTNFAPVRGLPVTGFTRLDNRRGEQLISQAILPAEYITPYVHTAGVSANYSDETYTQTLFRLETIYDVGIPFFDLSKVTLVSNPPLPGTTKKNMWKGMIAFDRPTWIRAINKRSTVFLSGQFFWHYLVNNPGCEAQTIASLPSAVRPRQGSCLVGGLDLPSSARIAAVSYRDKVRDWETLFTFGAFTFYRGGSVLPLVGIAVDPVNQFNMEPFWMLDYVVRDDFVVNVTQRYFVTPRGRHEPIFDSWGFGALSAGRSETSLRFTYQF
jgi:hypothetical protein